MSAAGFDVALPFHRLPASHDPRAAFIFEGVGDNEPIGDAGLMMGGAAGLEIDRADPALGTPPHALVVATASGFSNSYLRAIEEVTAPDAHQGGPENPAVRGDMVFFETRKRWSGLRRRIDHLDGQSVAQRLRESGFAHHRQRPARLCLRQLAQDDRDERECDHDDRGNPIPGPTSLR